jgi:hypothetical protein
MKMLVNYLPNGSFSMLSKLNSDGNAGFLSLLAVSSFLMIYLKSEKNLTALVLQVIHYIEMCNVVFKSSGTWLARTVFLNRRDLETVLPLLKIFLNFDFY